MIRLTALLCPPGHRHDALCDPSYVEPRVEPTADPTPINHRRFMAERNQDGWLAWQTTRPLPSAEDLAAARERTHGSLHRDPASGRLASPSKVPVKKRGGKR